MRTEHHPELRCIEPSAACLREHPGHALPPDQARQVLPHIYDSAQVWLTTNAWGRPDHPRHTLREVRMAAFVDPISDEWRWSLEVWSGGLKITHDYPHPPTSSYTRAANRLHLPLRWLG